MVSYSKDLIFVATLQLNITMHQHVNAIPVKICLMLVVQTVLLAHAQNVMLLPILFLLEQNVNVNLTCITRTFHNAFYVITFWTIVPTVMIKILVLNAKWDINSIQQRTSVRNANLGV